jgi:hypothetical protein
MRLGFHPGGANQREYTRTLDFRDFLHLLIFFRHSANLAVQLISSAFGKKIL